jgi:undecaprenyl-diphosphatase
VRDVASDRSAPLTAIAHAFSWAGSGVVLVPLALIVCVLLWRRARTRSALLIAISMAGGIAISSLDKVLVSRGRPPVLHLETVTSASFPSGHTTETTSFCLALLLTVLAGRPPRILGVLTPLATVATVAGVAMSRIYLGVHYPTDIIGGVVLGGGWTVLVYGLISDTPRSHEPKTHLPKRMSSLSAGQPEPSQHRE